MSEQDTEKVDTDKGKGKETMVALEAEGNTEAEAAQSVFREKRSS